MKKTMVVNIEKLSNIIGASAPIANIIDGITTEPIITFHDGKVFVKNNSSMLISFLDHPFENITINFKNLETLIGKLPKKGEVILTSHKNKFRIKFNHPNFKSHTSFPVIADFSAATDILLGFKLNPMPEDFKEGLAKCIPILPTTALKYENTLVQVSEKQITVCDNLRVSRYYMKKKFKTTFYLTKENCTVIANSDFNEYGCEDNHIQFHSPDSIAIFMFPASVNYPNIDDVLFKIEDKSIAFSKEDMLASLSRVSQFSTGSTEIAKKAHFEFDEEEYSITSSSPVGRITERGKLTKGINGNFSINPVYFAQNLSMFDHDEAEVFIGKFSNGHLFIVKSDNFKTLLTSLVA